MCEDRLHKDCIGICMSLTSGVNIVLFFQLEYWTGAHHKLQHRTLLLSTIWDRTFSSTTQMASTGFGGTEAILLSYNQLWQVLHSFCLLQYCIFFSRHIVISNLQFLSCDFKLFTKSFRGDLNASETQATTQQQKQVKVTLRALVEKLLSHSDLSSLDEQSILICSLFSNKEAKAVHIIFAALETRRSLDESCNHLWDRAKQLE